MMLSLRAVVTRCGLVSVLLLSGCVPHKMVCPTTYYWPDPSDDTGVQLRLCDYTETATDDRGNKWLAPRDGTNFIYKADHKTNEITRIELDAQAADIAAGAGFVWAVPSLHVFANFEKVYKIEPVTGAVDAEIELPRPYRVFDIGAGRDYVWLHGDLNEGLWSYGQYATTQIDPGSNQVAAIYVHPKELTLKDGSVIKPVGPQTLVLIDENDYLILHLAHDDNGQLRFTEIVLRFDTGEYSALEDSRKFWASCPRGEDILLTKTGVNSCKGGEDIFK